MVVRRRIVVHGRVQGVGFRVAVSRRATARNVGGWVRNLPDGSVESVLEGEPESVEALVRFCERGPRGAAVSAVEVAEEAPAGLSGFDVR